MSRGGKAPVGGGGGQRRAIASARSSRRAADEGREPRAPGMDALQDAEPTEIRELELKPVQRGIARGVTRRRSPLHLERLLHSLPAAVLRHLGLLARLARRHGRRSRVGRGSARSGASSKSGSRARVRGAEARRLRVSQSAERRDEPPPDAFRQARLLHEHVHVRDWKRTERSVSADRLGGFLKGRAPVSFGARAKFPAVGRPQTRAVEISRAFSSLRNREKCRTPCAFPRSICMDETSFGTPGDLPSFRCLRTPTSTSFAGCALSSRAY